MTKPLSLALALSLALLAPACSKDKKEKTTPEPEVTETATETPAGDADTTEEKTEEATGELREALIILRRVHFPYDSSTLVESSRAALSDAAEKLSRHPDVAIFVQGHADARGTTEYNVALGDRRAQMVADYLRRAGIEDNRLKVVSYGEEKPLASTETSNAKAKNRRVDFKLMRGDVRLVIEDGGLVDDAGTPITAGSDDAKDKAN